MRPFLFLDLDKAKRVTVIPVVFLAGIFTIEPQQTFDHIDMPKIDSAISFQQQIENNLEQISKNGYVIIEKAFSDTLMQRLKENCLENIEEFTTAGIGRKQRQQLNTRIRTDKTLWFSTQNDAQAEYLALMDDLRTIINQTFYLGLFDYECHFAKYEQGDFYKKHLDAFRGRSNRVFTSVCYLNSVEEAGELIIYEKETNRVLEKILPKKSTLVLFESERFPHEVLAAQSTRYSIAGWFRKNNSMSGMVDPSQ